MIRAYGVLCFVVTSLLVAGRMAEAQAASEKAPAQVKGLPSGARIIETRAIKPEIRADRALVLWMINPTENRREGSEEYSCPEFSRGSHFSGPTRASLVNAREGSIINTIPIKDAEGEDRFDIPFRIRGGFYYTVKGVTNEAEGTPTILDLKDINGDGVDCEFALFDQQACMGLATTSIGYSRNQDKVICYPIHLTRSDGKTTVSNWADYLFEKKPISPGVWKYEIDYRGRGGSLDSYEIRYNREQERFTGKLSSVGGE